MSAVAIAQSGLVAATLKLSASASNTANINDTSPVGSTRGYKPTRVLNQAIPTGGVTAQAVTMKPASLIAYDPESQFATAQGLVDQPDIDPITEVTNQLTAGRAFAFSLEALKAARDEDKTLLNMTT